MDDGVAMTARGTLTPRGGGPRVGELDVRVLGPLEVRRGGEHLGLGGPKQRTVLGLLIASGGRAVAVDALIDGVWGDDPPEAARSTLQSYVSNLRKGLDDAMVWEGDGYRLDGPVGFFGSKPVPKPTVTGSRDGNEALASLLLYRRMDAFGLLLAADLVEAVRPFCQDLQGQV
jgi:DNA-binding winged helix-turn-helix (wHTH) protein